MRTSRFLLLTLLLLVVAAVAAHGQQADPTPVQPAANEGGEGGSPEPPAEDDSLLSSEEAYEKWGTWEDPGPDPDPEQIFVRYGQKYRIERFEKKWAVFDQPDGWVRPFQGVNIPAELYRQDDDWVWVWMKVREKEPEKPEHLTSDPEVYYSRDFTTQQIAHLEETKKAFAEVSVAMAGETLHFSEASDGLPRQGNWRNSAAIADIDGDGHLDIITPPQRGGTASLYPYVFRGDGEGNWSLTPQRWPRGLNYGAVAAADFNGDGRMDLAIAYHLGGLAVFLNDGDGGFVNSSQGLPDNFPTRRVIVADFDGDGAMDIAALSEGPTMHDQPQLGASRLRVYLNEKKGTNWKLVEVIDRKFAIGGDWLTTGDFNGDRYPDLLSSSIYFNKKQILFLSDGKSAWKPAGHQVIPGFSYHTAVTAGKFTGGKRDDAVVAFSRTWPESINPLEVAHPEHDGVTGIDLLSFGQTGEMKRIPIVTWPSKRAVWAMNRGDFNGDGHLDIVFVYGVPREMVIYLGDGKGGFRQAKIEGAELPDNRSYDIQVADFNRDGRDDILMLFEDSGRSISAKDGSVRVYMNITPGAKKPVKGSRAK